MTALYLVKPTPKPPRVLTEAAKERGNARRRERYATDPEYRARIDAQTKASHARNPESKRRGNKQWQARQRAHLKASDPELLRHQNFRGALYKYGLSPAAYEAMLISQNGVCAICRQHETAKLRGATRRMSVDHDHATGAVRGLLCTNCNQALGKFKDNTATMRAAADYVERARS
jgi:hypothetical protein